VRELVDLQLFGFSFFVAAGKLREKRRAQITQFLCVHLSEFARQLQALMLPYLL